MLACSLSFFVFIATPTTEIYTLSLHDALPIFIRQHRPNHTLQENAAVADNTELRATDTLAVGNRHLADINPFVRSEEHTSELQSQSNLVCRLLLEKKK